MRSTRRTMPAASSVSSTGSSAAGALDEARPGPLTMTSVTDGSASSGSSGPSPATSCGQLVEQLREPGPGQERLLVAEELREVRADAQLATRTGQLVERRRARGAARARAASAAESTSARRGAPTGRAARRPLTDCPGSLMPRARGGDRRHRPDPAAPWPRGPAARGAGSPARRRRPRARSPRAPAPG